jgi:hypothetical protein
MKAHFGFQFIRASTFVATDTRDKISGLLGMSSFGSGRIVPDDTKTVETAFTGAATLLLTGKDADFYMIFLLRPLREEPSSTAILEHRLPS